jgi:hypothetical protein
LALEEAETCCKAAEEEATVHTEAQARAAAEATQAKALAAAATANAMSKAQQASKLINPPQNQSAFMRQWELLTFSSSSIV